MPILQRYTNLRTSQRVNGLGYRDPEEGEVEAYDNSALCLYDMERYGMIWFC